MASKKKSSRRKPVRPKDWLPVSAGGTTSIPQDGELLSGVEDMQDLPDALFVADIVRDNLAVLEAKRLGIPVVGIVDSNADPDLVDYVIPANDDAIKSLEYIFGFVKEALGSKAVKK